MPSYNSCTAIGFPEAMFTAPVELYCVEELVVTKLVPTPHLE